MTYEDIKDLNEHQVQALFAEGKISEKTLNQYFERTSVWQRNLAHNRLWASVTDSVRDQVYKQINTPTTESIPGQLRALRLEAGLTQKELAEKLGSGYSDAVVRAIESGRRPAGVRIIQSWAEACRYDWEIVFQKQQD